MPSTPTMYWRFADFTHTAWSTSWKPGFDLSKLARMPSENPNVTIVVTSPTRRARRSSRPGHASSATTPASGRKIVTVSQGIAGQLLTTRYQRTATTPARNASAYVLTNPVWILLPTVASAVMPRPTQVTAPSITRGSTT